jgi:tetratricopeptide (TPR) repeat protein
MRGRKVACRLGGPTAVAALLGLAPNARADAVARFADAPSTAPSSLAKPPPPPAPPPGARPVPSPPAPDTPRAPARSPSPGATAAPTDAVPPPAPKLGPRSGADQLSDRATAYAAAGRITDAIGLYTESIRLDPSSGVALVALGKLRAQLGEFQEAEQLFSTAARIRAVAGTALVERAHLRHREGRDSEATADLELAVELGADDPAHTEELAVWYVAHRAWLPALAAWRRAAVNAEGETASRRAALQVRALGVLAADLDVVRAGRAADRSWTRRALARLAATFTP